MQLKSSDLISADYLAEQVALHAAPRGYGGKGSRWADAVVEIAERFQCKTMLDYGAGQGSLARALLVEHGWQCREYDPAVPRCAVLPQSADLVVCTDVIEHVEPDRLDAVLAHLRALTRVVLFAVIATRPASKTLSDGRNAHLLIESAEWWEQTMRAAGFAPFPNPPRSPGDKPSREWVALLHPA